MKILTAKNGIALVAVLAILLVLTLLLPLMFSMSENATKDALKGTDKQRSSYIARTMVEMSVAAFEDTYGMAFEKGANLNAQLSNYGNMSVAACGNYPANTVGAMKAQYQRFLDHEISIITMSHVYVYEKSGMTAEQIKTNGGTNVVYSITKQTGDEYKAIGEADCSIIYDDSVKYYKINSETGESQEITKDDYDSYRSTTDGLLRSGGTMPADYYTYQYTQINNRNVEFNSTAIVNNKVEKRKCVLVLPTEPDEQQWILPTEVGTNQIFPDSSQATGMVPIDFNLAGIGGSGANTYVKQPLYTFSCLGNMVISFDNLKYKDAGGNYYPYTGPESNIPEDKQVDPSTLSFGLYPEVSTLPERDSEFNCFRAVNMASWYADGAQKDNFVAFTATNAIEVDCPVNLLVNPCRTDRLGDGVVIAGIGDKNYSLYKIMIYQAPTIVFKQKVNTMVSLYTPPASKNDDARRMTSIILSAPKNSPYSYINTGRNPDGSSKTRMTGSILEKPVDSGNNAVVNAGKVYFLEDFYIWVIPYLENGSPYAEHWYEFNQTVYYKDKDMKFYKFASAGDVYYFNADITTKDKSNNKVQTGFSITGYFLDVIYPEYATTTLNADVGWWKVWSRAKQDLFTKYMSDYSSKTYVKEDLFYLGNISTDENLTIPVVDDYYILWDS